MAARSLPVFDATTTAEAVADASAERIRGKNVLVTGTSLNGLGYETARTIAKHANLVVITGHNDERLNLAAAAIRKSFPTANVRTLNVNLASLAAVRKAAAEVNAYAEPIHVLINNAARPWCEFSLSPDGLESQMATGHVGPFLFTNLIVPKLLAAGSTNFTPRVVWVSSVAHALDNSGVDFAGLTRPDAATYDTRNAYHQVKSANVLTAGELSRRAGGRINSFSLNPGLVYTNMLVADLAVPFFKALGALGEDGTPSREKFDWKTLEQGAATTVVAAFDPRIEDFSGSYLDDCVLANEAAAPHSTDPDTAKKLWEITEDIVGEKFTF
ncbi:Short-chain dehydrogenase/reductase family protein [Mycena indigotica]|uniref:Short-chain dehydrogenase/reductase family protein n=1 Tax=Mycena indigotica TaxID=2126181 RepID=A0A8H6T490_9AGAR|nr:Short-chain dehydrogenase/reductase family protein [Mycena indigotica]KAF7311795.1 Short-chain dehydrogenase/reductase family protein [Mycena indigotica]